MSVIEQISNNATYKQIVSDSFGGILYDVANRDKYDTTEILALWDSLTPAKRESVDGIMSGVFAFITEVEV